MMRRKSVTCRAQWTSYERSKDCAATLGSLDVAINNAGVGHDMISFANIPTNKMERRWAVNVIGGFFGMRTKLEIMK